MSKYATSRDAKLNYSGGGVSTSSSMVEVKSAVSFSSSTSSSSSSSSSYAIIQQLPEFPSCGDFAYYYQCKSVPVDKFYTLVTMYRAHSQRILDSVNKFNFGEVSNFPRDPFFG